MMRIRRAHFCGHVKIERSRGRVELAREGLISRSFRGGNDRMISGSEFRAEDGASRTELLSSPVRRQNFAPDSLPGDNTGRCGHRFLMFRS
jgi:hypothetical protein